MNNNKKQLQLTATTNGSNAELHLHPAVSITAVVVQQHTTFPDNSRRLVCETECKNEQFEIMVLNDVPFIGMQIKFRFIRETIERLSGWKVYLFKMYSPASNSNRMIADRQLKELYITADLLRMPLRAIAKLISSLPYLLSTLSGRVKSAVDGLYKSDKTKLRE